MESLLTTHNQITPREAYHIQEFLLLHKFNTEELYEEMFDHIATSFEENTNSEISIVDHLNTFYHQCGGEIGLKKIKGEKVNAYNSMYRDFLFKEIRSYFRWPIIIYLLAAFALISSLNAVFKEAIVTLVLVIMSIASALFVQVKIHMKYRNFCKINNKPYRASLLNQTGFNWVLTPMLFVNGLNLFTNSYDKSPLLVIVTYSLLMTFMVISQIATIKVLKLNSKLKPAI